MTRHSVSFISGSSWGEKSKFFGHTISDTCTTYENNRQSRRVCGPGSKHFWHGRMEKPCLGLRTWDRCGLGIFLQTIQEDVSYTPHLITFKYNICLAHINKLFDGLATNFNSPPLGWKQEVMSSNGWAVAFWTPRCGNHKISNPLDGGICKHLKHNQNGLIGPREPVKEGFLCSHIAWAKSNPGQVLGTTMDNHPESSHKKIKWETTCECAPCPPSPQASPWWNPPRVEQSDAARDWGIR